mgnify:CR=1 FL=1
MALIISSLLIIPYQEIIGNYSTDIMYIGTILIIPYQEIIGNYSLMHSQRPITRSGMT